MSYVPPHMRNRKQPAKEVKVEDSEFPTFVSHHKPADFKGPSFLSKIKEENKPEVATKEIVIPTTRTRYSYYERRSRYGEYENESESESEPEVLPKTTTNPEDAGWQVVERKVRVKRDKVQEALDNDDAPIEDEQDESAWDEQPEEYETYWDDRKH